MDVEKGKDLSGSGTFATVLLEPGELVSNRYEVLDLLGSGGMATVYRAADTFRENEIIALKVLHRDLSEDKMYVQRFVREVTVLHMVDHPNVVKTYDISTHGKLIYFTMEYIPGKSLQTILEEERLPYPKIAALIIQLCNGLQAIHQHDIIHRDIKPENILIREDGLIKITDFGVARDKASRLTTKTQKLGSIVYMAPEVWLGKTLTPAVDYYSLGILLYELVTGSVPFEHEYPGEMMMLHLEGKIPSPRTLRADVPNWLNDLILQLLAKSPKDRAQSSQAIIEHVTPFATETLVGLVNLPHPENIAVPSPDIPEPAVEKKPTRPRRKTYIFKLTATRLIEDKDLNDLVTSRPRRRATVVLNLPRRAAVVFEIEPPSRDFIYFGVFLASLQIFDGVLTSLGVHKFGTDAEGNFYLRELMIKYGPSSVLWTVKLVGVCLVIAMTVIAKRLRWVKDIIGLLSCLYLFAAVLPWLYLLFVVEHLPFK